MHPFFTFCLLHISQSELHRLALFRLTMLARCFVCISSWYRQVIKFDIKEFKCQLIFLSVNSSRLASKISLFPQATGMSVLASVLRVIASILAFWPVSGWMPSIFPKLLGLNTSTLVQTPNLFPLEPKEAVSVMWILVCT